jgi:pyruvate dehydrogenase E2 component (dihydrolipoamide acetyltransferase)
MAFEFRLPDLGEGIREAQVLAWKVVPGQDVAAFQALCDVESAKAAVELTAPVAGRVRETRFPEGATAKLGDVLVVIDTDVDGNGPAPLEAAVAEEGEWFGIVGSAPPRGESGVDESGVAKVESAVPQRVRAAPFVRKLARDLGVPLEDVAGSGVHGRVRIADVEAQAAGRTVTHDERNVDAELTQAAQPASRAADTVSPQRARADTVGPPPGRAETVGPQRGRADTIGPPPGRAVAGGLQLGRAETGGPHVGGVDTAGGYERGGETVIPLRGLRKAIADHMVQAWRTAPQVTSMDLFDVTELVRAREILSSSAQAGGARLTYLPLFVKAAIQALQAVPEANAVVDDERGAIVLKADYHIGLATAVPGGLVVPVVKHADRLSVLELAGEIERLVAAARERRSAPSDLSGSTFTITSFGGLPGSPMFATPIVNYPEVAILGLGRIELQPRVVDGQVVARQCLGVSLTFDHRVLDGEGAGRFMAAFKRFVEQPLELLLHLK